jgi:glutamate synthase domain-containing protein 1
MLKEGIDNIRIPSGCSVSAIFSKSGKKINGGKIVKSICLMHDRSNGLGGGFAGYGIYPTYKDYYALHVFYENSKSKEECEKYLEREFDIVNLSKIPTKKIHAITDEPLIWRYFVTPMPSRLADSQLDENEFVVRFVTKVNSKIDGAYIFSSGKNMGVFKAVGFPEDVGNFTGLKNTKVIPGRRMDAIRRIRRDGGAARTRSVCWITQSSITEKFPRMTQTGVSLKCTAINVIF